jgi:predicted DNA binding CopG/RHH family protein
MVAQEEHMKKTNQNKEKIVRLNFDLPEKMRNAFKAKAATEGLKVKDVLTKLVAEYLKEKNKAKEV